MEGKQIADANGKRVLLLKKLITRRKLLFMLLIFLQQNAESQY